MSASIRKEYTAGVITIEKLSKTMALLTSEEEYESYITHPQKLSYSQIESKAASECTAVSLTK